MTQVTVQKEYKKRKDENIGQWIDRLAPECCGSTKTEVHKMLHELVREAYMAGIRADREVSAKLGGRIK